MPTGTTTGIDLSLSDILKAKENHQDCNFKQVNLDDAVSYKNRFDTILMLAVIEHLFNLKHIGLELAGALRPGGKLIITSPTNFGNDIIHRIGCRLGLFSKTALDDHICIFNKKRFEIFAIEVGLTITKYQLFQFGCNQLVILQKPLIEVI